MRRALVMIWAAFSWKEKSILIILRKRHNADKYYVTLEIFNSNFSRTSAK